MRPHEGWHPSPLLSPPSPALLTAHCPARQKLGGIASSSCRLGLDCGAGTGTRSHARLLPERAPARFRLGLVPAGAPGKARSGKGFGRQGHFPNPSQSDCPGTPPPPVEGGVPPGYCLKPFMHPPRWEPIPAQACVSGVAVWSPAKSSSSPLSRRSRNSAACSRTWILLATGSMSGTAGGRRA